MKNILLFLLAFILIPASYAQPKQILLTDSMFDQPYKVLTLSGIEGWYYKPGSDSTWDNTAFATQGWKPVAPDTLFMKERYRVGKTEGWLRLQIQLDSNLALVPVGISSMTWAASDIFINGHLITSFGQTGAGGKAYQGNSAFWQYYIQPKPYAFQPGRCYTIAIHFVDSVSGFRSLFAGGMVAVGNTFELVTAESPTPRSYWKIFRQLYIDLCAVITVIGFLFLLLWFANKKQSHLMLFAGYCLLTVLWLGSMLIPTLVELSLNNMLLTGVLSKAAGGLVTFLTLVIISQTLRIKVKPWLQIMLAAMLLTVWVGELFTSWGMLYICINFGFYLLCIVIIAARWRRLRGSQWAIALGLLATIVLAILTTYAAYYVSLDSIFQPIVNAMELLAFPIALVAYVATRFREVNKDVQAHAETVVKLSEEKKEQAVKQQQLLQEEVDRQTRDLRKTLTDLKSAQAQLIQSEKMASLGELTAGIAHEIQNPLNFVNNFSDVSSELLDEMKDELEKGNYKDALQIANDVKQNLEKINHHGKRADGIVKGMLQHSRTSSGQKELTDINTLADEYLRLAYHGLRAKDKTFNAKFETDFDKTIQKINVVPQDTGRVILNLINNAFYAVSERKKQNEPGYEPSITISTKKLDDGIEIKVKDNGNGIPPKVVDKIFQPFFTTKPAGEGTGLGLSLSYDIIKAHGGELKVETKEGDGAVFTVVLKPEK